MTAPLLFFPRGTGRPRADLAFEEDALAAAARGRATLLAYRWRTPVLVLGYAQEAASVDLAACARHRIPVLRRISGGTGVLHHHALSLSLALPLVHPWACSIGALYDGFVESLRAALAELGHPLERGRGHKTAAGGRSPLCFEDRLTESLLWRGRKVLGCAQARRKAAALVHGTLLFGLDAALQAELYGVPEARVRGAIGALPAAAGPDAVADAAAGRLALFAGLALERAPRPPVPSAAALSRYDTSRWAPGAVN